jgi:hypothetical protein
VDFPPSLPIASCAEGTPSSNYLTPLHQIDPAATEELHVISVYDGALPDGTTRGFREHPQGQIDVTVRSRSKPVVLYLGSGEPQRWRLHVDPGAVISRMFTASSYAQEVDGVPDGVPVTALGYGDGVSSTDGWELVAGSGGSSFLRTIRGIRELTGLVESSFQGLYPGSKLHERMLII